MTGTRSSLETSQMSWGLNPDLQNLFPTLETLQHPGFPGMDKLIEWWHSTHIGWYAVVVEDEDEDEDRFIN